MKGKTAKTETKTVVRQLVEFQDIWSKDDKVRKSAWEQANEWLRANVKKEVLHVTPLFGNSKRGYYVGKVSIEYLEAIKC